MSQQEFYLIMDDDFKTYLKSLKSEFVSLNNMLNKKVKEIDIILKTKAEEYQLQIVKAEAIENLHEFKNEISAIENIIKTFENTTFDRVKF